MAISTRLKYARERAGFTLAKVREITGIVESSVSDFENGHREPKLSQLQSLAKAYNRSIEFLLSDDELPMETVLWCEKVDDHARIETQFLEFCGHYHNLEIWNDAVINFHLPIGVELSKSYEYNDVEMLAKSIRNWLGLGDRPGVELQRVLEEVCGVKVFYRNLQPMNATASIYSEDSGMAVLINAEKPRWQRNYDLAHGLFHLLTWRTFNATSTAEQETLANIFADCLLMPAEAFCAAVKLSNGSVNMPINIYFEVARQFDVPVDVVVRRWYSLKYADCIDNGQIDVVIQEIRRMSGILEQREDNRPSKWPDRYRALAIEALRNGRISTGRFAQYLDISRRTAMEYVAMEDGESEEAQAAIA